MSGPLPAHRTPSRPLLGDSGEVVIKLDGRGRVVMRHVLKPGDTYKDGRCVDYQSYETPRTRHVLDWRPEHHQSGKHARGRMRPRTAAEQRRIERLQARADQIARSTTSAINRLAEPQAA